MRGEPVLHGWIFEFHQASNFTAASAVTALLTSRSARKMCILLSTAIKCCGCPAPFASAHPLSYKIINPLNFTILLSRRTNKICTNTAIYWVFKCFFIDIKIWAPYWNLAGLWKSWENPILLKMHYYNTLLILDFLWLLFWRSSAVFYLLVIVFWKCFN